MLLEVITLILPLLQISNCSLVVDSASQAGIYLSDYCPKMPYCAEGAHVMCMYYNPNSVMGPRCSIAQNVSVTPAVAASLLEISNAVRSKIALGKEKGKGGEPLPRAYGMFRLKWDNELATFAQVLANQCVLRHDLCRATKRFPNPGQTAGLVRFTYPDWFPVSKGGNFKSPGLSDPKLLYAATQSVKSWYNQKHSVTPTMIYTNPDWNAHPNNQAGRLYLEMIHGPATHIGCGMSAYREYVFQENRADLSYNSVQVICNYSAKPQTGTLVYNTTQPTSTGYTVRCGCPPGSDEDEKCLCTEINKISAPMESKTPKVCSDNDPNCQDPTVVVLPIFTMEDAPPSKLITPPPEHEDNTQSANDDIMDIFKKYDHSDENENQGRPIQPLKMTHPFTHMETMPAPLNQRIVATRLFPDKKPIAGLRNQYLTKKSVFEEHNFPYNPPHASITSQGYDDKKSSIFTKDQQFHLPNINSNVQYVNTNTDHRVEANVPRNDFEEPHFVVNTNMNIGQDVVPVNEPLPHVILPTFNSNIVPEMHVMNSNVNENILNNAEQSIMNYKPDWNMKQTNTFREDHKKYEIRSTNTEPENVIHLLDKLEKEINNIEFKGNEKEVIDAKIRKIYGSIIGDENLISNHRTSSEPKIEPYNNNKHDSDFRQKVVDDRTIRYKSDDKNKEDTFKHRDRKNSHADFKVTNNEFSKDHKLEYGNDNDINQNDRKKSYDYVQRGNYGPDTDLDSKKYSDDIGGFDVENHLNADERSDRDYEIDKRKQKLNTYDENNRYRNRDRMYEHRLSGEETEIKRARNMHDKYDDELRPRNTHKSTNSRFRFRNNDRGEYKIHERYRNNYLEDDDFLSPERRKYYQEKIEKLQRRIDDRRQQYAQNKDRADRPMRPMRPTEDLNTRPSKRQMDLPYIPDRARFLHGF